MRAVRKHTDCPWVLRQRTFGQKRAFEVIPVLPPWV